MAFLDGLYGSRRRMATAKGAGAAGRRRSSSAVAAPRPVRQLYWKLRSRSIETLLQGIIDRATDEIWLWHAGRAKSLQCLLPSNHGSADDAM
uniref:Uncharacterized protein n=1 Tax=Oryza meridionalis TaxID=40149 RepID=A0A0E0EYR2_9ORYZ